MALADEGMKPQRVMRIVAIAEPDLLHCFGPDEVIPEGAVALCGKRSRRTSPGDPVPARAGLLPDVPHAVTSAQVARQLMLDAATSSRHLASRAVVKQYHASLISWRSGRNSRPRKFFHILAECRRDYI